MGGSRTTRLNRFVTRESMIIANSERVIIYLTEG